jgi:hypothetical protein
MHYFHLKIMSHNILQLFYFVLFYLSSQELFLDLKHASNIFLVQDLCFHRSISITFTSHNDQYLFQRIFIYLTLLQPNTGLNIIFTSEISFCYFFWTESYFSQPDFITSPSQTHSARYLRKYTMLACLHIRGNIFQSFYIFFPFHSDLSHFLNLLN